MGAIPGSDKTTIKENTDFFFGKRFEGKSLVEKYKVKLEFQKFANFPGNTLYDRDGRDLGSINYFKKWWKIFDKEQALYSAIIKPSKDMSFTEAMKYFIDFLGKLYKAQIKLRNPSYNLSDYLWHRKLYERMIRIYDNKVAINKKKLSIQICYSLAIFSYLFIYLSLFRVLKW